MSVCKINIYLNNNISQIISYLDKLLSQNVYIKSQQIVTLNLLMYLYAKKDINTYYAIKNAKLVLPDSAGIVLAGFLSTKKIFKRIPGIELIFHLCKLAEFKGYKIFLLGSKDQVVRKTKDVLEQNYKINIVGFHHGYFDFNDTFIINKINFYQPDILFVGLPTEKQEKWIYCNLNKLKAKIVIGVGGSFDVISGRLRRAPKIFLITGMEWLFRLIQEPWRIKRVVKLPISFLLFLIDVLSSKIKFCTNLSVE